MKCIDTTYLIDAIRKPEAIRKLTEKLDSQGVHATTVINVYGAFYGAYAVKDEGKRKKIIEKLSKIVERLEVLSFTHVDAVKAAEIAGKLSLKGMHIGVDAIVAAIAINNRCEAVVTRNEKHFRWIGELTGLRVESYQVA
jgi:predicted nucleic acid-binding protein